MIHDKPRYTRDTPNGLQIVLGAMADGCLALDDFRRCGSRDTDAHVINAREFVRDCAAHLARYTKAEKAAYGYHADHVRPEPKETP